MNARKLILNNCFSYRELLRMKNAYVKAIHEVYGKGVKVSSDETFEKYILVIADSVSSTVFTFITLGVVNTGILIYIHGLTRGPLSMFIISMITLSFIVIRNSRVKKVRIKTAIKLIKLRLKMFIFMITPP